MNSLRYIVVDWIHESKGDPVRLYSEIDAGGWENRRVEEFKDGKFHYADAESSSGDTRLGEAAIPPPEEIAGDIQFRPREIPKVDFESVWIRAKNG